MDLFSLLAKLAESSLLWVMFVLFVVQLSAHELGRWFGRWHARRGRAELEGVGLIVGGLLGLLGFVLALTLSFSTTRFQDRQASTLAEANAIGTAWLRAQAVSHPSGVEIARLLEAYTHERRDFVLASRGSDEGARMSEHTVALQAEIWEHAAVIARERPDALTSGLLGALTEAFDAANTVRFTLDVVPPSHGVWLLLGLAVLSIGALGYRLGLKGPTYRAISAALIGAWSLVIVVILDLGAPRAGGIVATTSAYDWLVESQRSHSSTVPEPPSAPK